MAEWLLLLLLGMIIFNVKKCMPLLQACSAVSVRPTLQKSLHFIAPPYLKISTGTLKQV